MPATTTKPKMVSLKALQTKLRGIQTSFNNMYTFMEQYREDTKALEVNVRLEQLDRIWDKLNEAIDEVESHEETTTDAETFVKDRVDFENRFYQLKSFLLEKSKIDHDQTVLNQSSRSLDNIISGSHPHVRLPQITLPKFSGRIDEWLTFRDLYTSLIHWQPDLPEVEKFHYLRSQLEGEALAVIDSLPLTKANYTVAWELLTKRYSNTKILCKRQVQALFELPSVKRESASDLHSLLDTFEKIVKTLDQVTPTPADYKDMLLLHILCSRLDNGTRRSWEEFSSTKEVDTVKDLTEFLQRRVRILESLPNRPIEQKVDPSQLKYQKKAPVVRTCNVTYQSSTSSKCPACTETHLLYQCSQFMKMPIAERDGLLRSHSLCRNCFRRGHHAKQCLSKFTCRQCNGRHHTLVCFKGKVSDSKPNINEERNPRNVTDAKTTSADSTGEAGSSKVVNLATTTTLTCNATTGSSSGVLLLTAIIVLEDDKGRRVNARALLDSAAECNLISSRMRKLLSVKGESSLVEVIGIQGLSSKVQGKITVLVRSRVTDFAAPMEMFVLPKISAQVGTATIDSSRWDIPSGVELADPSFLKNERVDLVLGAESFFDLFASGRRIQLGDNLPSLVDSVFGWVVTGRYPVDGPIHSVLCDVAVASRLDEMMERFWKCEEIGSERDYSLEEARCEENFVQTTRRNPSGRYTVSLPKNDEMVARLGDSRVIAERRFSQLERRLGRDARLREQYVAFLEEYAALGHMKQISPEQAEEKGRCYLPHHPVLKEESTTTKVRVVFDASANTTSDVSLNDCLQVGPIIQEDLRSIVLRSRTRQVLLVADIEKMFRQVDVCPDDRCLQSILWRSSSDLPLATYELVTVTYGTKPAPFLATRTLVQLAVDEAERFPLASVAVQEDFYMDDAITGADDPNTARSLRIQLEKMLASGGFKLRKFASNCDTVLEGLSAEDLSIQAADGINLDRDPTVKTLGLVWMPNTDVFRFRFQIPPLNSDTQLTKRKILSTIATLFDPLGLIGAVITKAKIFMQMLWRLEDDKQRQLSWDSTLPMKIDEEWRRFHHQIPLLNELRIERLVSLPNSVSTQLHIFCDASQKAYGACAFLRTEDSSGVVKVILLSSKSRVAPLKTQSIPRLELCAALLAAEMFVKIKQSIRFTGEVFFWSDSTVVLSWLKASPTTWTTFVANRVSKVQTLTEHCNWRHVPGEQNPADLISRGILPEDIIDNELWWKGPNWLSTGSKNWPRQQMFSSEGEEEERRRIVYTAAVAPEPSFVNWLLGRFSRYIDVIRRTALVLRYLNNLNPRKPEKQEFDFLTTEEMQKAEYKILQLVQQEVFPNEHKALDKGECVSRSSPLRWYNPFIAPDGLIRVGGRIGQSRESENAKHPIVLPARHRVTKLLMRHYHHNLMHAGPQLMLSTVRLRYWPLGGRNVAREVCHKCVRCFRTKPAAIRQFMAELPAPRVTPSRPFSTTGVDYFGPVYLKAGYRRPAVKAYVAVFVCFATKATHLELVSDLLTARFIQALRRFTSRRGKCAKLYSDNGTNFVGARNQLKELLRRLKSAEHQEAVAKACADEGMQWHFIPPGAPHFGGLWEAAVRAAKVHMLKVLGDTATSYEDMTTLLDQVECCLNSRPLTQLSDDPGDLQALTPGHFLVGSHLQAVPEEDHTQTKPGSLDQFEQIQQQLQVFWKRWRTEYLVQLQARTRRWRPSVDIAVGSLVVIRDDNQPPTRWKMGRISETHPGPDGVVRVVTLKTMNGPLRRPVTKICVLPVANSTEAEVGEED